MPDEKNQAKTNEANVQSSEYAEELQKAEKTSFEEKLIIRRRDKRRKAKVADRRKKEFTYRGFTLEQLKKMTLSELLPVLPARCRRSLRRGFNIEQQRFIERFRTATKTLRTHCRDIIILPEFIGKRVAVHNGKEWKEFEIKPEMIGHYLGEFALTRKPVKHSGPGVGATRSSKFMPLK